MKLFVCSDCGQTLFYENYLCTNCGAELAFIPEINELLSTHSTSGAQSEFQVASLGQYRHCSNRSYAACNWAVPANRGTDSRCEACALNEVVPDLGCANHRTRWADVPCVKRSGMT